MSLRTIILTGLLAFSVTAAAQVSGELNKTDGKGMKQGYWIKKYPNGNTQYEGTFRDNHPVGELRRYYEDNSIKSDLIYSADGKKVDATMYHPNGFIASQGIYLNQLKEGKWKFFSAEIQNYLICEEYYSKNRRNGLSLRYYPDSATAEKINFVDDIKEGEWLQFHENGKPLLRANYSKNRLDGKFESWYKDGKPQISGAYKNDFRDGTWKIYKPDGTIRYTIHYVLGSTTDRQIDIDASHLIDSLELNKDRIPDPEKTGMPR